MDIEDIPLWFIIVFQILITAMNAGLSVLRVSVSSLSDGRVRRLAEDGDQDAISMLNIENIDRKLFTAISFSYVLINVLSGIFVMYPVVSIILKAANGRISGAVFSLLFIIALVFLNTVFGFVLPERIAQAKETEKSSRSRRNAAMHLFRFLRPTVWLLIRLSDALSGLFGISEDNSAQDVTEDEILLMVDQGEESGSIESNEKEMIENVFNFSSTTASEVMTHRTNVIALSSDDPDEEILNTIIQTGKSRFPVYDEDIDSITGILIARDYLLNLHSASPKPFKKLLRPAYLVPETVKTNVLFRDMQLKNIHMAVVVDEYGGTAGIVTMEDLLEEIVGNIYDEFDQTTEQNDIVKLEENVWRVAGNVNMETLAAALETDIECDEEFETLGGLVFSRLSTIPDDGSHPEMFVNGLYVYVEELSNRRIEWARVSLIMGPAPEKEHVSDNEER